MPAKKNAGPKRRKNAAPKMKTIMTEPEDVAEASELKVFEKDALDSTFVINKDVGEDVRGGRAKITTIEDNNGVAEEMGNGDAQESLDKIEEETDETEELKMISKKKGRAKATAKKEKPGEPEFADKHQKNDGPGSSPKRPLDESFNEETAAEEPPTKRGREKGGRKAQAVSRKNRKTKNEPLPVANVNDADEMESSSEEAATEEPSLSKSGARARKGRKAKEDEEEEEEEESESKVCEEKPAAVLKKGRPATKAGSPETNNSENSVENVAVAREKTTKKRATKEKAAAPVPSTRSTRTRKPISYGETADEAENVAANKKPNKKAAPKKAALLTENATKAGAGTKRRGRVAKEASDEAEEEE